MPELFDLGDVDLPEIGQRLFGQPCRHADAQAAGDQFDDGEACRDAGAVEQPGQHLRPVGAARGLQLGDDIGERRCPVRNIQVRLWPDQRDGFRQVADIVVGIAEQHRIHALGDQCTQHRRLDRRDAEVTGDGGQRQAAIRILDAAKIVGQQRQLAVARRRQHQAIEKLGEAVHEGMGRTNWRGLRSVAPPSVLPDISPTWGEIGFRAGLRQSPTWQDVRQQRNCQSPPKWGRWPAGQRGAP